MKIAQVIHNFLPYSTGGSELSTYFLSKILAAKHEIYIFHSIADSKRGEYEVSTRIFNGLNVYEVNNTWKNCSSFELTYKNENIAKRFAVFIDGVKPDIVHFHHLTCLSTTLIEEVKKRDIPIIFTLHDYWLICQRGQMLKRDFSICDGSNETDCVECMAPQLDMKKGAENALAQIKERVEHIKYICSLVDLFIAPSRFVREKYIKLGLPGNRIIHCEHGMNLDIFKDFKKNPSKRLRFGYIGAIIPSKGLHVLIKAFNDIEDDAELKIYGYTFSYHGFDGYLSELKKMASNPNIKFMGGYDNMQLHRILSETDVLIVPSIWHEISSLTIKEAFITRTPVIASRIGGITELIDDNKNGLLFEAGDYEDLHRKIRRFIREPGLIEELSKNVPPVRTIEENTEQIESIYSTLVKT